MWEELGWEEVVSEEFRSAVIVWRNDDIYAFYDDGSYEIGLISGYKDDIVTAYIDMELQKAINKQIEEIIGGINGR